MIKGNVICVCVLPFKQHKEDILLGAEVLHRGCPSANLTPEDIVEDLSHVLLALVAAEQINTGLVTLRF